MFECSHCGLSLTRWVSYLDHVSSVHNGGKGITEFKCATCRKVFHKEQNFQAHCQNLNPKPCRKCTVVCCTRKQLEKHRRLTHPSFQCPRCDKYFQRKDALYQHERIKFWKSTSCSECDSTFCTTKALKLHVIEYHKLDELNSDDKLHHGEVDAPNSFIEKGSKSCPVCFKLFFDHYNVKRHLRTEHEKSERHKCPECDRTFACKASLNYHVKALHEKNKMINCESCNETFHSVAKYYNHKKSHIAALKFECDYCDKNFNNKSNLNRHKQESHSIETRFDTSKIEISNFPFECDQCSYIAKRKAHLIRHSRNKHSIDELSKSKSTVEKKTCPHCFKTFCNSTKVRRHIRTMHEGTDRFGCNICEKTFASKGALDHHSSSHALGRKMKDHVDALNIDSSQSLNNAIKHETTSKCHLCEKTFLAKNLRRHLKEVHYKTKINTDMIAVIAYPHACEQCSFRTKRKYDLKQHKMQQHSLCELTFPCEVCGKAFKYQTSVKKHEKKCKDQCNEG